MNIIETNLSFGSLSNRSDTQRIILHHAEASECTAEDIHRWHKANGWAGAGYHFLVRKGGGIYRLRPEWALGAHASGANYNSIGICFEGAYNSETMPEAQVNAGRELVAWLKDKYGISTVQRHKDVCSTDCPGANFPFDAISYGSDYSAPEEQQSEPQQASGNSTIAEVQSWAGANPDGIYGSETRGCLVRKLQSELNAQFGAGLAVDGIFGACTKAACVIVRRGAEGNITRTLQGFLICHGYGTNGFDGIFGGGTENAVISFQRDNGLDADGIAGKNTFAKLAE